MMDLARNLETLRMLALTDLQTLYVHTLADMQTWYTQTWYEPSICADEEALTFAQRPSRYSDTCPETETGTGTETDSCQRS